DLRQLDAREVRGHPGQEGEHRQADEEQRSAPAPDDAALARLARSSVVATRPGATRTPAGTPRRPGTTPTGVRPLRSWSVASRGRPGWRDGALGPGVPAAAPSGTTGRHGRRL